MNDTIIFEFRRYDDEPMRMRLDYLRGFADSYGKCAAMIGAALGLNVRIEWELVRAGPGSFRLELRPVFSWIDRHRKAVAEYSAILALPVAVLAMAGIGGPAPAISDERWEQLLERLDPPPKDLKDPRTGEFCSRLSESGADELTVRVPEYPSCTFRLTSADFARCAAQVRTEREYSNAGDIREYMVSDEDALLVRNRVRNLAGVSNAELIDLAQSPEGYITMQVLFDSHSGVARKDVDEVIRSTIRADPL